MKKLDKAYKSIGEVAEILGLEDKKTGKLNTHTLRFWEKQFKQIKPKFFYKESLLKLDDLNNKSISNREIDLILKLNKISKIIKEIKNI